MIRASAAMIPITMPAIAPPESLLPFEAAEAAEAEGVVVGVVEDETGADFEDCEVSAARNSIYVAGWTDACCCLQYLLIYESIDDMRVHLTRHGLR